MTLPRMVEITDPLELAEFEAAGAGTVHYPMIRDEIAGAYVYVDELARFRDKRRQQQSLAPSDS